MVAFTGAGISTSAGIPDFRGPQVFAFSNECRNIILKPFFTHVQGKWTRQAQGKAPLSGTSSLCAIPTATHMGLVELLRLGKLKYLISQNCDGLHRRSGVPGTLISELHGNGNMEICESCGQSYFRDISCRRFVRSRDHFTARRCSRQECSAPLLEYTIDFGQCLPVAPLQLAESHSEKADLHIVFGSSLTVSPACDLPAETAQRGGKLVIVNLQETPLDDLATIK